jgi:hypothetical protein
VHFYCIISDTHKCTFIYITLFHNTAIHDIFQRLSRRHHQGLYRGLHIKSVCFVVGFNNVSRTHYQENGYTNDWLCSKTYNETWILCEDLGIIPDDGVVIGAETCRVQQCCEKVFYICIYIYMYIYIYNSAFVGIWNYASYCKMNCPSSKNASTSAPLAK